MEDKLFNGEEYQLNILISLFELSSEDLEKDQEFFVMLRNCSQEYYEYARFVRTILVNEEDPFSEPVISFGNIRNGDGIFGGFNASVIKVEE